MHHRPPGNCNYAAILIIWDRMFGTFRSEKEQQDYYGLAKQYDTFDPVWANFEHIKRIVCNKANAGFADLFKRRVKHKLVFEPLSVFKPLPPPVRSRWHVPKEPKRTKLDPELPAGWFVYCVVHFLVTLVIALVVLMEESLAKFNLHVCPSCFYFHSHLWEGFGWGRANVNHYGNLRICLCRHSV